MPRGVFPAIITPFKEDGGVDEEAYKSLIDFQLEGGVDGIVVCGTTGESPTLTQEEKSRLISLTISQVNKRGIVIVGTGSNCTAASITASQEAERLGVDGIMVVNPYYNKPTQEGLYLHFKAVHDATSIPLMIYNIKGRTGVNVDTSTLMRLMNDCPRITSVKEASGDIEQMKAVIAARPEGFTVLSGDDGITLELIKAGGDGVVSVAANVIPDRMAAMTKAALDGRFEEAAKLDAELRQFFEVEFIETNPIPIKAALALMGKCKEVYRLPMCSLQAEHKEELKAVLSEMKIV
jgi:4-hydroxy-tetrahydrodipicolinate synthase